MRQFFLTLALALIAGNAQGVTLVVGVENWMGPADARADGTDFAAAFADGTCIGWFDGCDDLSDFVITDPSSGSRAAQAILDQVLLRSTGGLFRSPPQLTDGCVNSSACDFDMPIPPRKPDADLLAASPASRPPTPDARKPQNAAPRPS